MKKIISGLIAAAAACGFAYASEAQAAGYTSCTVSDVQYVKVGAVDHFVFKACGYFWYSPTSTAGQNRVSEIVEDANNLNRLINVQCGINGGTCATVTSGAYEGNVHASRTLWSAETVKIAE